MGRCARFSRSARNSFCAGSMSLIAVAILPVYSRKGLRACPLHAAQRGRIPDADVVVVIVRIGELFLEDALPAGVLLAVAALSAMTAPGSPPGLGVRGVRNRVDARRG